MPAKPHHAVTCRATVVRASSGEYNNIVERARTFGLGLALAISVASCGPPSPCEAWCGRVLECWAYEGAVGSCDWSDDEPDVLSRCSYGCSQAYDNLAESQREQADLCLRCGKEADPVSCRDSNYLWCKDECDELGVGEFYEAIGEMPLDDLVCMPI